MTSFYPNYSRSPKSKEECETEALKSDVEGDPEAKEGGAGALEAKMSLMNGITVIVGSIIGSGIFVSPTGVLKYTGSVNASLLAIVALTFSVYVLKPIFPECDPPEDATRLLAACCICEVQHFTFEGTTNDVTSIALSFYSGLFAYNGWNYLNFIIEELKDPVRNLPRAIAISCTLVTVVYTFTNVLGSAAVAVTFAERLFGWFALSIPLFVAASTFGAVNGVLLTSSRLFYAGAAQGQMPEMLTMVSARATPAAAVLAVALLSLVYLTVSDIYALINYVGFATWLSIGAAVLCLPVLRYTQPNLERPIKVNLFFPVIYIICTILVVAFPAFASPAETGVGCLMILTAVPVYLLLLHPRTRIKCLGSITSKCRYRSSSKADVIIAAQNEVNACNELNNAFYNISDHR
ncbi:hypothetical protein HF086_000876 [Spodoptera exigua]|uniref:Uncharacterized protein n=1 Tax=Spodoptera exigua TaxID=7107 RepID=A0A922MBA6_SPOEX|nr:hypothetical protein HF086_000876 [Spodoptera exigua]